MSTSPTTPAAPATSVPAVAGDVFELAADHEQVVFCTDEATGLRAIVAIHSTALGPALGGTRFYPYASTDAALRDVLDLSRGMTYKAAVTGLDLGGGKATLGLNGNYTKTDVIKASPVITARSDSRTNELWGTLQMVRVAA